MIIREEWPTLLVLLATYFIFAGLTLSHDQLPMVILILGLAVVIAMHSSLQHEVLHGHPFRSVWLNDLMVFPALGMFVPYLRFKDTHLAHHYDPDLTDPYDDPESNFLDRLRWQRMPWGVQWVARFNNTLLGRMFLGPVLSIIVFYIKDFQSLVRLERRIWLSYILHLFAVALVLIWVLWVAEMDLWMYLVAAYLGMSLLKIRTFLEHQAHERAAARSVIIEDRGPLALLFLNNNYHAVHHAYPRVQWHKLPALFQERRELFLSRNGGYQYASYAEIFARYFLKAKDPVVHPFWTKANRTKPPRRL